MLQGFGKGALSVEFDEERSVASLSRGNCRAEMGKHSDVFWKYSIPPLQSVQGQDVRVEWPVLSAAFRAVMFAASRSDRRPVLRGVCLAADGSGTDLVALDGVRMAVYRLPLAGPTGRWIIPAGSLKIAGRLFKNEKTLTITLGEGTVQFAGSAATLAVKTIEEAFPSHREILGRTSQRTTITTDRLSLLAVVRRMAAFSPAEQPELHIRTGEKRLYLSMEDVFTGTTFRDELDAEIQGQPLTVAFNPRLLQDVLNEAGGDRVTIGLESSFAAASFRGGLEGWTAVVMPLRWFDDKADAA
jgi:DNA polymerase-3 subunit beta